MPCLVALVQPDTQSRIELAGLLQDQVLLHSYAVEPIVALAASLDGAHCAGGGQSGTVYLWEVPSGRLLRSWPAHYKVLPQRNALSVGLVWLPARH